MSEENKHTELMQRREAMAQRAAEIDKIAADAAIIFQGEQTLAKEIQVAQAMVDMRRLLTDEIMAPICALQNTDLGFRTDRDPKVTPIDKKTGKPMEPYPPAVVRDVMIEAMIRGFRMVRNEVNIIAGRCYGAKNGFFRKVREFPGLTCFCDNYDVFKVAPGGESATMQCRATWLLHGKPQSIGIEPNDQLVFTIRVNAYMGPDAIRGKCERKLLKAVHDRLTGSKTPDGEVEDPPIDVGATVTPEAQQEGNFARKPKVEPKPEPERKPEAAQRDTDSSSEDLPQPEQPGSNIGDSEPVPEPAAELPPAGPSAFAKPESAGFDTTNQTQLRDWCDNRGFTLEHWKKMAVKNEMIQNADAVTSWLTIPADAARICLDNIPVLAGELATIKAQEPKKARK